MKWRSYYEFIDYTFNVHLKLWKSFSGNWHYSVKVADGATYEGARLKRMDAKSAAETIYTNYKNHLGR